MAVQAGEFTLPPPAEGVIRGQQAVVIWPADEAGTLLDPAGCEVHLTPNDRLADDLVYPCGKWFQPPKAGRYDFWLEQGDEVSPSQSMFAYVPGANANNGFRSTAVLTPAGVIKPGAPLAADQTFRVVSLSSPGLGFERRLVARTAANGVRVPAGQVLGGIFDAQGNAVALARPADLGQGETLSLRAVKPKAGMSDVLAVLRKHGKEDHVTASEIRLELGKTRRAPDVLRVTQTRVFAVWYGVPAGTARVQVAARNVAYDGAPVTLVANEVATVRGALVSPAK
ncbi:MAG TPA: hypothetical protein VE974_14960 [Thermoanaerobaculia bacterium]|nr:hypothetical protein [Thermoanaerobaculia bacterium]